MWSKVGDLSDSGLSPTIQDDELEELLEPPRRCVVCREVLKATERKVHAGACAHRREMELQQRRRQRHRLPRRPDDKHPE